MIKDRVQVLNPLLRRWVKLSTVTGRILSEKRTPGPWKGVKVHKDRKPAEDVQ